MAPQTITQDEIEALAAKLDRLDAELTDNERAVLNGLLGLALDHLREEAGDEVSGFGGGQWAGFGDGGGAGFGGGGSLGQGFKSSFTSGGGGGAGFGGTAGSINFSRGSGGGNQAILIGLNSSHAGFADGSV